MKYGKKILAIFLVLVTLTGMLPITGNAAQTVSTENEVSVSGTNEFGQLLSESISDAQQSQDAGVESGKEGYGVTALTIEGNIATVTYDAMEEAILLVALYSEENGQLICSGKTTVTAENTQATLTIEGEMPEFFEAAAFLLDTYDMSPLCPSYATPMYTKQMQELLASTAEDYVADGYEVLQLEEEGTTNFAVYNKSVVVIDYQEGVNEVVSADADGGVYIFENCDEQITGLTTGAIMAYSYSENDLLLIKIFGIMEENNQVTIYADSLELEEVFDYLKIETGSNSSEIEVDPSTCEEGVTYEGLVEDKPATRAWGDEVILKKSLVFTVEKEFMTKGDNQVGAKINGTVTLGTEASLSYYISLKRQFVELKMELGIWANVQFSGVLKSTGMTLAEFKLPSPVWGIVFECAPKLIWEFEASSVMSGKVTAVVGFSYDSESGWQSLNQKPTHSTETSIEGKLFMGVELDTSACILDDDIASIGFSIRNGLQISGKMTGTEYEEIKENAAKKHTCDKCLSLRLDWVTRGSVFMKIIKIVKVEYVFLDRTIHIGDMYWSFDPDYGDSDFGKCPHYLYRVTVKVQDRNGDPVPDQQVFLSTGESLGKTGEKGTLATYVEKGNYTFQTTIDGETLKVDREVTNATRVVLTNNPEILKKLADAAAELIKALKVENHATYPEKDGGSGTFSSGVTWKIYRSGIMIIEGDGEMDSYSYSDIPWKNLKDKIKAVEFRGDITNVCNYAFSQCYNLKTVILADATVNIGSSAFQGCTQLENIRLPANYRFNSASFLGCNNVEKIQYGCPEDGIMPNRQASYTSSAYYYVYSLEYIARDNLNTVIFEEGIENVADYAFYSSSALQKVFLCSTITEIGEDAFYYSGITQIEFPEGLTTIESDAFQSSRLTAVEFPESLESIGSCAFDNCYGLTELVIPDHLARSVGTSAFRACTGLKKVTVPADLNPSVFIGSTNIESIRYTVGLTGIMTDRQRSNSNTVWYQDTALEAYCRENLKQVTFDEGITRIGNYAFYNTQVLESVELPSTLESIGYEAFYYSGITQIEFPEGLTTIESYAFENSSLTAVAFRGNAPAINNTAFRFITAAAYYPAGNSTWTAVKLQNYGGTLTWEAYTPEQKSIRTGGQSASASASAKVKEEAKKPENKAIFGGEYSCVEIDGQIVQTAYFENLQPGKEYAMIAVIDPNAEDLLAYSNLLAIMQAPAESDGTLVFDYIPRQQADISYVFATGASHQDVNDAVITFPAMVSNGQAQTIEPVVTYNGKVLTEEVDYIILGDVDYTQPGDYTCYIRGIREYTGLVTCRYTVMQTGVSTWNISLSDHIAVNFRIAADPGAAQSASVRLTVGEETQTTPLTQLTQDAKTGEYLIRADLAAAQMTEEVLVQIVSQDQILFEKAYTVAQYAAYIFDPVNGYDMQTVDLVRQMLHYGAGAQLYFGYRTEDLANTGIYEGWQDAMPTKVPVDGAVDPSPAGFTLVGMSLVFDDYVSVRFYFNAANPASYTFTVGGEELTPYSKNGMYYVEVTDLVPQDWEQEIALQVNGNVCARYSPVNYMVNMYHKTEKETLQTLLLAMYRYYLAALSYCS